MQKETKKIKNHAVVVLVLLLALLGAAAYLAMSINAVDGRIGELVKEHRALEKEKQNAISVKNFLRSTRAEREELGDYFISSREETIELIELLDTTLAGELGMDVAVDSVAVEQYKARADADPVPVLRLSVKTEGTFAQVYRFSSLLETLPYNIAFDSVSITRAGETPEEAEMPLWNGAFTLRIVSYEEEQ